ncbi:hypothetical protein MBLNU457_1336t1 [Dothideomycetes sp. NU457]
MDYDAEKVTVAAHHERLSDDELHKQSSIVEYTPAEQKAIIKRLDIRIVTMTGLIYCISLMDRTNLSNASIAGMNAALGMNTRNNGYSIATLVFFCTYIVFQPPSTVLTRKIGPRVYLSTIALLWGVVMIGMGFTKDWKQLAALRIVLGIFEAGYFPGAVYLLSTWYTRYEMGKRYAIFYMLGCVASAFAGILAFGLMQLAGQQGIAGWSWIFIIEGAITCAIALAAYVFLVPFPDADAHKAWKFLSEPEIAWIMRKVDADRGDVELEPFTLGRFLRGGADIKIWGFAMIFCCTTTVSYALAYFLPLILRGGMGFSVGASQCLVAPPYAFAGFWMFACGWFGDKYRVRGPIIAVNAVLEIVGLALMGWTTQVGARYFGVFLACAGANCNVPAVLTYQANNIRGQWKRAFCSATLVGFGGIGGIVGSLVFRPQDFPRYEPGLYACITAGLLTLVIVGALSLQFKIANGKADSGVKNIEGSDDAEFRYTY